MHVVRLGLSTTTQHPEHHQRRQERLAGDVMGDSTGPPHVMRNTEGHGPRPFLPLAALVVVLCVLAGGTATTAGVLLSFTVAPESRPWVWAAVGTITAGGAGLLLGRGTTAAARRFPNHAARNPADQ